MTPWQNRVTALTRRMADDMKLRNYSQKTIDTYTYHVGRFAQHIGKSLEPDVEPHFHENSYGYRSGKSALDAVGVTRR